MKPERLVCANARFVLIGICRLLRGLPTPYRFSVTADSKGDNAEQLWPKTSDLWADQSQREQGVKRRLTAQPSDLVVKEQLGFASKC
jgi:hypothetical protein